MDSRYREEAERWLSIAEKLLASRDLQGTRTFAIRVRDRYPALADQVLAVADTLLVAQSNASDWYGILQLPPLTDSAELVASQYRKLILLLNPARNNLSFADQALRFVSDAWNTLSNPSRKAIYDNQLRLSQLGQLSQPAQASLFDQSFQIGFQQYPLRQKETQTAPPVRRTEQVIQFGIEPEPHHQYQHRQQQRREQQQEQQQYRETQVLVTPIPRRSLRNKDGNAAPEEERPANGQVESTPHAESSRRREIKHVESSQASRSRLATESTQPTNQDTAPQVSSFWTACPYCYVLYEYPKDYEDCTLRCQKCKRAFQAVSIPSPPLTGKDNYFCCWGFFPLGISGNIKNSGVMFPNWSPVSPIFPCPGPGQNNKTPGTQKSAKKYAPSVFFDYDAYVDSSDSSGEDDDEWEEEEEDTRRKRGSRPRGRPPKNAKRTQSERVRKGNGKKANKQVNLGGGGNSDGGTAEREPAVETSRRGRGGYSGRKQMGKGRLDLNVEFSNEVEEQPTTGRSEGNRAGYGEEDNSEGNAFFEGLDEFLSSLPILSGVADDKVKAT